MISDKKWHRHQARCIKRRTEIVKLKRVRQIERTLPPLGETLKPIDTTGHTEELNKILGENVWGPEGW